MMGESTKIQFRYRRIQQLEDITDLVEMLFPGNRNQQHAAARILLELKTSHQPVASLSHLEGRHGISGRILQRTRAKLTRLGLIEHVTWMNSRYGGQQGWRVSSRMSATLRRLADWVDEWRKDARAERMEKDDVLVGVLG